MWRRRVEMAEAWQKEETTGTTTMITIVTVITITMIVIISSSIFMLEMMILPFPNVCLA
jgi:hypothetical protein